MAVATSKLGLSLPADGEAGWGAMVRQNFSILDQFASGQNVSKILTGGTYTLSATEGAADSFEISGVLTANQTVVVPNNMPPFAIENLTSGNFTLSVKTAAGAAVVLPRGLSLCYANGAIVELVKSNIVGQLISTATTAVGTAATRVALGGAAYSSGGLTLDTALNQVTCINPGTYRFSGKVGGVSTAAIQSLMVQAYLNGAPLSNALAPHAKANNSAAVAGELECSIDFILDLVAGDDVSLWASGSVANGVTLAIGRCSLLAQRL